MTQPEQWRFQWPDGTWIRWNPNTQAWEKETPDGAPGAAVAAPPAEASLPDAPAPAAAAEPPVAADDRAHVAVAGPEERAARVADPEPEPEPGVEPAPEVETRSVSVRRLGVDELIPSDEDSRASLWPTILAGAVIGIPFGLVVYMFIR